MVMEKVSNSSPVFPARTCYFQVGHPLPTAVNEEWEDKDFLHLHPHP